MALDARRRVDDARKEFALSAKGRGTLSRAELSPLLRTLGDDSPAAHHFSSNLFGGALNKTEQSMNKTLAWPDFEHAFNDFAQAFDNRRDKRIHAAFLDFAQRLLVCKKDTCKRLLSATPSWLLDDLFDAAATPNDRAAAASSSRGRAAVAEETVRRNDFHRVVRPHERKEDFDRAWDEKVQRGELGCADSGVGWCHHEFIKTFTARCVHCDVAFSDSDGDGGSFKPEPQARFMFADDLGALLEQLDRTLGESIFASQLPHIERTITTCGVAWRVDRRGGGGGSGADDFDGSSAIDGGGGAAASGGASASGVATSPFPPSSTTAAIRRHDDAAVPIIMYRDFRTALSAQMREEGAYGGAVHFTPPLRVRCLEGASLLTMPELAPRDARWRLTPIAHTAEGNAVCTLEHVASAMVLACRTGTASSTEQLVLCTRAEAKAAEAAGGRSGSSVSEASCYTTRWVVAPLADEDEESGTASAASVGAEAHVHAQAGTSARRAMVTIALERRTDTAAPRVYLASSPASSPAAARSSGGESGAARHGVRLVADDADALHQQQRHNTNTSWALVGELGAEGSAVIVSCSTSFVLSVHHGVAAGQSGQSGRGCYMPCTADVAEVYELKLDDNPQLTLAVEEGRSGSEWWWSLCCHHLRLLSLRGCTRCWLPRTHAKIVHVHADGALHVKYGALGEEFRVNPDFVCAVTPLSPAPSDTSRATTLKRRIRQRYFPGDQVEVWRLARGAHLSASAARGTGHVDVHRHSAVIDAAQPLDPHQLLPWLSRLTELEEIDLSWCDLDAVPLALFELRELTTLIMSHNRIYEIPAAVTHLTALCELDLRCNNIEVLPLEITALHALELLDVGDNFIEQLPPTIVKLVSLRTLAVDGNKLRELPPAMLSQMTHLVELSASRNSLDRIEFREVHHPRYGYRLERLDVSGNFIQECQLGRMSKLIELDLSSNDLKEEGFLNPFKADQLPNLEILRLCENRFRRLPSCFNEERLTNLRLLDLSDPRHCEGGGGGGGGEDGAEDGTSVLILEHAHGTTMSQNLTFCFTTEVKHFLVGRPGGAQMKSSRILIGDTITDGSRSSSSTTTTTTTTSTYNTCPKIEVGSEDTIVVSRSHCTVSRRSGKYYLKDANSKNGSFWFASLHDAETGTDPVVLKQGREHVLEAGNVVDFIQAAAVGAPAEWGRWSWCDLDEDAQVQAILLGFTRELWDTNTMAPNLINKVYADLNRDEVAACRRLGFPPRRHDELLRFEVTRENKLDLLDPGERMCRLLKLKSLCVLNLSGGCINVETLASLLKGAATGSGGSGGLEMLRELCLEDNELELWIGDAAAAAGSAPASASASASAFAGGQGGGGSGGTAGYELCCFAVRCNHLVKIRLASNRIGILRDVSSSLLQQHQQKATSERIVYRRVHWTELEQAMEVGLGGQGHVEFDVCVDWKKRDRDASSSSGGGGGGGNSGSADDGTDDGDNGRVNVVVHGAGCELNGQTGTVSKHDVLDALASAHLQPRIGDGGVEIPEGSLRSIEKRLRVKLDKLDEDGNHTEQTTVNEMQESSVKWVNLALCVGRGRVDTRKSSWIVDHGSGVKTDTRPNALSLVLDGAQEITLVVHETDRSVQRCVQITLGGNPCIDASLAIGY